MSLALDKRLAPAAREGMRAHLQACPACREWQQEQSWLWDLIRAKQAVEPGPGFHAGLLARIAAASRRPRHVVFSSLFARPMVLRAAMLVLLVVSALLGFSLSGRLEDSSAAASSAFNQTLNLDVFVDLPGDSFGAVYERLLRGEFQ